MKRRELLRMFGIGAPVAAAAVTIPTIASAKDALPMWVEQEPIVEGRTPAFRLRVRNHEGNAFTVMRWEIAPEYVEPGNVHYAPLNFTLTPVRVDIVHCWNQS